MRRTHFLLSSSILASFDMLARPAPDLTVDAAQRQMGGLGIPLIRALMDNATYHREGARNILRLTRLPL
jgi:anti-sigma regulatory factor (Ser/Thr protein kinase)